MNYFIGGDSQFAVSDQKDKKFKQKRGEHEPGAIRNFLAQYPEGTPVVLESIVKPYWIVDEIEPSGCQAM